MTHRRLVHVGALLLLGSMWPGCAEISTTTRAEDRLVATDQEREIETISAIRAEVSFVGERPFDGVLRVEATREDTCVVERFDRIERQRIEERRIENPLVVGGVAGLGIASLTCAGLQMSQFACVDASTVDSETGMERPMTAAENTSLAVTFGALGLVSGSLVAIDLLRARDRTTTIGAKEVDAIRSERPCGVRPASNVEVLIAYPWRVSTKLEREVTDEDGVIEISLEGAPLEQLTPGAEFARLSIAGESISAGALPEEWERARVARLEQRAYERALASSGLEELLLYFERFPDGENAPRAHALFIARVAESDDLTALLAYLERSDSPLDERERVALRDHVVANRVRAYLRLYAVSWRGEETPPAPHALAREGVIAGVVAFHLDALDTLAPEELKARAAHTHAMYDFVRAHKAFSLASARFSKTIIEEALALERAVHEQRTALGANLAAKSMLRARHVCQQVRVPECEALEDRVALRYAETIDASRSREERLRMWAHAIDQAGSDALASKLASRAVTDLTPAIEEAILERDASFMRSFDALLQLDKNPRGVWGDETEAGKMLAEALASALISRAGAQSASGSIEVMGLWREDYASAAQLVPSKAREIQRLEREALARVRARNPLSKLGWKDARALYPPTDVAHPSDWYARVKRASRRNKGRVVVIVKKRRRVGGDLLVEVFDPSSNARCLALLDPGSGKARAALEQGRKTTILANLDGAISYTRSDGKKTLITRLELLVTR